MLQKTSGKVKQSGMVGKGAVQKTAFFIWVTNPNKLPRPPLCLVNRRNDDCTGQSGTESDSQ